MQGFTRQCRSQVNVKRLTNLDKKKCINPSKNCINPTYNRIQKWKKDHFIQKF